jgi:hypothetical protein
MRFDEANDDITTPFAQRMRLFEHAKGLPNAGGEAKVQFEPSAFAAFDEL